MSRDPRYDALFPVTDADRAAPIPPDSAASLAGLDRAGPLGQTTADILRRLWPRAVAHDRVLVDSPDYAALAAASADGSADDLARRQHDTYDRCQIPRRFWPILPRPQRTTALHEAFAFLHAGPRAQAILVLSGGTGCGKTTAACWALADTGGRFLDALAFSRLSPHSRDEWESLRFAPLLVLDDLGAEVADSKASFALLHALLTHRHANLQRTILTTNLDYADFTSRYCRGLGERLRSRLIESGTFASIAGPDLRTTQTP